jgi:flap endonuclease-1
MGVKNFNKFIQMYCPESIKYIHKKNLYGKTVGIDGNFWLYQIMASLKSNNISVYNQNNQDITHIYGLYLRINSILKMNMRPIFVFDGKPPALKYETIQYRKKIKNESKKKLTSDDYTCDQQKKKLIQSSFFLSRREITECKLLLQYMNIPYIQSIQEADSQLAWLKKNNTIDFIVSNDFDILIFGGNHLLPYFKSNNKYFTMIDCDVLKQNLNLSDIDLIKISILLGNDYTHTQYAHIDIHNVLDHINNPLFSQSNSMDIINYFQNPDIIDDIILDNNISYSDIDIYKMELSNT